MAGILKNRFVVTDVLHFLITVKLQKSIFGPSSWIQSIINSQGLFLVILKCSLALRPIAWQSESDLLIQDFHKNTFAVPEHLARHLEISFFLDVY